MNHRPLLSLTCVATLLFGAAALLRAADDPKPLTDKPTDAKLEPLFNGKDLSNFKVPTPNPFWSVIDGVLTGQSDPADPVQKSGNVMYTEKAYKDFVVESDIRFADGIDSGFMYAGKPGPDIQVQIGVSRSLKVDMTGSIFYRSKYPPEARAIGVDKLLKLNDWNTIRVEVKGRTTNVWLNGQQVLHFDCPEETKAAAPIGLQLHGGVKMKMEFRNLKVAEL